MGIGVGIFLIAVGAILTFAVETTVNGVDLDAVGWILMLAGAVGVVLDLIVFGPRRRTVVEDRPVGTARVERSTTVDREVY